MFFGFSHHSKIHNVVVRDSQKQKWREKPDQKTNLNRKKIPRRREKREAPHIKNYITEIKILNMSLHLRNHRERIRDARIVSKTCSTVAIRSATDAAVASALASAVSDLSLSLNHQHVTQI